MRSLDGKKLEDAKEIFVADNWSNSPTNFGGRMVFGRDGMLYVAIGERQEQDRAQNTMLHGGKVLRLQDDGTAAPGQSVRRQAGLSARDLLGRSPQPARARLPSDDG